MAALCDAQPPPPEPQQPAQECSSQAGVATPQLWNTQPHSADRVTEVARIAVAQLVGVLHTACRLFMF